jgi:DNA-binding Lrp family transcriptional regulator
MIILPDPKLRTETGFGKQNLRTSGPQAPAARERRGPAPPGAKSPTHSDGRLRMLGLTLQRSESSASDAVKRPVRKQRQMNCVFIQIRCKPGTTYRVADAIALRELHSELYSTSGEWDLLVKLYPPEGTDIGKFINDNLLDIDGIERTLTTLTFKAF